MATSGVEILLRPECVPPSHTQFSWNFRCSRYLQKAVRGIGGSSAEKQPTTKENQQTTDLTFTESNAVDLIDMYLLNSYHLHVFIQLSFFLDPSSLFRLCRTSKKIHVVMEHYVWHKLLGENKSYLNEISQQHLWETKKLSARNSLTNQGPLPPYCWRQLYMRRVCAPWKSQTKELVEGVSWVNKDSSFRNKYDCHLFEIVVVGYKAESLVNAHCSRCKSSSATLPSSAAQRSSAYFTEHFYEDTRPPYLETQLKYQGLVAQLQISSQTMTTGYNGEFVFADAIAFIYSHEDKDGWRQIASVDIPLVQSTIDPAVPRFIICVVDDDTSSKADQVNDETPNRDSVAFSVDSFESTFHNSNGSYGSRLVQNRTFFNGTKNKYTANIADAAAFAGQNGFFFVEIPESRGRDGYHFSDLQAVDSVFFAIAATLLDITKRQLAMANKEVEETYPQIGIQYMDKLSGITLENEELIVSDLAIESSPLMPGKKDINNNGTSATINTVANDELNSTTFASFDNEFYGMEDDSQMVGASEAYKASGTPDRKYESSVSNGTIGEVPRKNPNHGSNGSHSWTDEDIDKVRNHSISSSVTCTDVQCGCTIS